MSNHLLPSLPGVMWSGTVAPTWATKVQRSVGGIETRAAFQSMPIRRYTLDWEFLRTYGNTFTEWQTLVGFFNSRQGSYDSFLYDDPSDHAAIVQEIGAGDGARVTYQVGRALGGAFEYVYNLVAAPTVYVDLVVKTPGVDYTISASGLITFAVAPAMGLSVAWTGQYYWRCRFDADTAAFTNFASGFWALQGLAFVTVLGA